MHPEVQQDQPGSCPKRGMPLVPRKPGQGQEDAGDSSSGNHGEMLRTMRAHSLWTNFTVIGLGARLLTSRFTFGYGDAGQAGEGVARVTAERGLASLASRGEALATSDLLSGAVLLFLGMLSLSPRPRPDFWGRWGACVVGIWLQFAPLVFWSPSTAVYLNDTLVGALVIALTVLIPMMPGMAHHMTMMKPGPEIPPGWTYNPSSWLQRGPIIALGFFGWFISRYLVAAVAMLVMIPLTFDEVVAVCPFLVKAHRDGKPLWRTFWVGDTVEGGAKDSCTPRYGAPVTESVPAMTWGVTVPWQLFLTAILGAWLMVAPAVLRRGGSAADSDHLVGALVATIAVITMAEVVRAGRYLNVLLGVWLVVGPWLLRGASGATRANDMLVGAALILLSLPGGKVRERYGTWDRAIV